MEFTTSRYTGVKEYSDWPTIPQLYVNKNFVGGCDILISMHQSGELARLLEEERVLMPAEEQERDRAQEQEQETGGGEAQGRK